MKNRTDRILLRIFVVSLVVYGVLLCVYAAFAWAQGLRYPLFSLHLWLVRNFHAVPFFALQLLLCRRSATGAKYFAVQLTALMLGLLLLSYIGYLTVRGWNILGFMIALSLSIAPVVGCVLAWVVYGVQCLLGRGKNPTTPRK